MVKSGYPPSTRQLASLPEQFCNDPLDSLLVLSFKLLQEIRQLLNVKVMLSIDSCLCLQCGKLLLCHRN